MRKLEDVDRKELVEFLSKGWMTHDGMWFFHCYQRFGIDTANELNLAAIEGLSMVEARRMKAFLGLDAGTPWTFSLFKSFTDCIADVLLPDFMRFGYDFPEENRLHAYYEPGACWAYKGVKQIGAIGGYRCGVFHRLECWFRAFDLDFTVDPVVAGCMMHTDGQCYRDFTFRF